MVGTYNITVTLTDTYNQIQRQYSFILTVYDNTISTSTNSSTNTTASNSTLTYSVSADLNAFIYMISVDGLVTVQFTQDVKVP